jgi:6-phosphogluconolactonase
MIRPTLLSVLAFAAMAEPFHIYTPSPRTQQVHVFAASEFDDALTLREEKPIELGFAGNCIVAHPNKPILYVAASRAKGNIIQGATIHLKADGSVNQLSKTELAHGYCHLNLDRAKRFLLGVEYREGHVDVYKLNADGSIGTTVATLDEGRKSAHCIWPSPDNKFVYIPYVKDSNALFQYAFDAETGGLRPLSPKNAEPPADTGPRHMQYHPELPIVYFSNEQGLGVSVYDKGPKGQLSIRQVVSVSDSAPTGSSGSDVVISPDGRFLFSGVRGGKTDFNRISRYRILENGELKHLGLTPADKVPWGLAMSPDGRYVLATAWLGATLTAYKVGADGSLSKAASTTLPDRVADIVTHSLP